MTAECLATMFSSLSFGDAGGQVMGVAGPFHATSSLCTGIRTSNDHMF